MSAFEWIPSLFAADPLYVGDALKRVSADYSSIHMDIMDGHFVPNISFGSAMVAAVKRIAPRLLIEVHLMVTNPEAFIDPCIQAGAQRIFIHVEVPSAAETCKTLQASGIQWGLVINPETPLECLPKPLLQASGNCLIMSVHPGFCGQSFIEATYQRVTAIRQTYPQVTLTVDGGINPEIANKLATLGVARCVAGSYCFKK